MYSRRPLGLNLTPTPSLLPSPSIRPPPDPTLKGKDVPPPSSSFHSPLLPPPPPLRSQPPPTKGGENRALLERPGEGLWSLGKSGVPLITPVKGPDLGSVALYQSLLRHHPAYRHLLDTFLLPPFPPLVCPPPPPALLADLPFVYCTPLLPPHPTPTSLLEEDKRRGHYGCGLAGKGSGGGGGGGGSGGASPPQSCDALPISEQRKTSSEHHPAKRCEDQAGEGGCGDGTADPKPDAGGMLTAEDLVSSITAIPDPYQQYGYGRKLFPCPQCRYTTDRRNNLKRHMLTMHQLSAKLLECCGLLFRTKAALREHALIFHYHGYTCFYCARRFCRKALLKRHLSVHNGQKEFLCSVCDYATSHKSNLERHRRVHVRQDDGTYEDGVMMMMEGGKEEEEGGGQLSEDEISVCSHDEDNEEINVHSD
ncbi:hypothetical protein ACOMHN_067541 [Nucella lapillus]